MSPSVYLHSLYSPVMGLGTCGFNGSFRISLHIPPGGLGAVWEIRTGSQETTETNWRSTPCYSGPSCYHRKHTGASDTDTKSWGEEGNSFFQTFIFSQIYVIFLRTVSLSKQWYLFGASVSLTIHCRCVV